MYKKLLGNPQRPLAGDAEGVRGNTSLVYVLAWIPFAVGYPAVIVVVIVVNHTVT